MKTTEEIKDSVQSAGLARIKLRKCSMCGYTLSYILRERPLLDTGCDCVRGTTLTEVSWDKIADYFNGCMDFYTKNNNQEAINRLNIDFGFEGN